MRNLVPRNDYCRIALEPRGDRGRNRVRLQSEPETLVLVPLTQAGAVQLDEELRALTLWGLVNFPPSAGRRGFPTPQELVGDLRPEPGSPMDVVALANPTDLPPAGDVGYWSDGGESAIAVTVSATGRRMFVEVLPGEEVRTNVLTLLLMAGLNF